MTSTPRAHCRVLGTWLCVLFLLNLIFLSTGKDTFTTGLLPFFSAIPLVVSNGATVFLLPDIVLRSSTPPPVPPRHPTPVSASHWVDPPKGRWTVTYSTSYDEKTLYNMAIRRPLNGTAKFVTRKVVTYLDPDEFTGISTSEDENAPIKTPVYVKPVALGLIGFPSLQLGYQVDGFQSRAITKVPHIGNVLRPSLKARSEFLRLSKLFSSALELDFVYSTVTTLFEQYGLVGTLIALIVLHDLAALIIRCMIMLAEPPTFCWSIERTIGKLADLYRAVSIQVQTRVATLHKSVKWMLRAVGVMRPEFIPERLLTPEESIAFRRANGISHTSPLSPSLATLRLYASLQQVSTERLESGMTYEEIEEGLNRFIDRDKKPIVDPPFLSPAWAERHRAETPVPSTQSSPVKRSYHFLSRWMPPKMVSPQLTLEVHRRVEGLKSSSSPWKITPEMGIPAHDIPLPPNTYEESLFLKGWGPRGESLDHPADQVDIGAGSFGISPSDPSGPSTTLLNPLPVLNSTTSLATPLKVTEEPNSPDAAEKNKQDPTLASEPSEPTSSDVDPTAQVSGTTSDAGLLGAPRLDSSSLSSAVKNASQASKPSELQCSDVGLTAQVSGTTSHARFLGPSRPEVRSFPDTLAHGSPNTATSDTLASMSSETARSGTDLTAQISGTVPKAGFTDHRLDVEAVLESSRRTRMTAQRHPGPIGLEELRPKSPAENGALIAQRRGTPLDSIDQKFPNSAFSLNAPTPGAASSSQATASSPSTNPLPSTTNSAVESSTDSRARGAAYEPDRREDPNEEVKTKTKKVVAFSETVQVQDLPMSNEDRDARANLMPTAQQRKAEREARKLAKREGKQPVGGSKKSWVPTPASLEDDDVDEQGFSRSQQQR
ncbi:hypothetical protein M407DRAFT_25803, partial [Tulasnella calospora MUT 4182]